MFTVNRIDLLPSLRRSLTTTNLIESPNSGVRKRTRRVTHWKNGAMALRWAASAFLDAEQSFRRIMGYKDLWQLAAYLDNLNEENQQVKTKQQAAENQQRLGRHSTFNYDWDMILPRNVEGLAVSCWRLAEIAR